MLHKYLLPLVALLGLGFAGYSVWSMSRTAPPSPGRAEPPVRPNPVRMLAGSGLVEASAENIPIGTPVAGVVWEVKVSVKEDRSLGLKRYVKKGDPLFILDNRARQAERLGLEASLLAAKAKFDKLMHAPRPEDVPVLDAARTEAQKGVEEARARLANAEVTFARSSRLVSRDAATQSEFDRDRYALAEAKATLARAESSLARAQADYSRLMAGTWKEDLDIAQAEIRLAEAALEANQIELDRLTVRAPVDGEILKVNVRPGQFAATNWNEPMVVLGDLSHLHVRVDIDEHDLNEFDPVARAWATPRGDTTHRFELTPYKVEPYVIPKRSLTGENTERVDTRVLQVIYALPDKREIAIYVGQQMDVYIEVPKPADTPTDAAGKAAGGDKPGAAVPAVPAPKPLNGAGDPPAPSQPAGG